MDQHIGKLDFWLCSIHRTANDPKKRSRIACATSPVQAGDVTSG